MRRIYQILLPLLSLFLVRVDLTDLYPLTYEVRLLHLTDGDTALVALRSNHLKVRFSKIDAPEKGQPFLHGQGDAGLRSLACASKVIGRQKIFRLRIHKQDIYKRVLGELDDLSFRLIEQGCASLYPHAEFASSAEKVKFIRALQRARDEKRGIWQRGGYLQPKAWRKLSKRRNARPLLHQSG